MVDFLAPWAWTIASPISYWRQHGADHLQGFDDGSRGRSGRILTWIAHRAYAETRHILKQSRARMAAAYGARAKIRCAPPRMPTTDFGRMISGFSAFDG